MQDVTERIAAARELQRSRDLFAGVLNAATEQSIIATDPDGLITVFNTGAERMLGYSADEMIGTSPERLHDQNEIRARAAELGVEPGFGVFLLNAAAGRPETRQWTYVTRCGERLQASITVTAMHDPDGTISGFIKVGTDITARVKAEAALKDSVRQFHDTFRYAPHGMLLMGIGEQNLGSMLQVNPALCRLTGYTESELLTMRVRDLVAPDDQDGHSQRIASLRDDPDPDIAVGAERHWIRADGKDLWVQVSISPTPSESTQPYVVGQVEDITARKQVEEKLRYQALHDGLTGLPNRMLLMDRIEHALAMTARSQLQVAVMYIDLDGFKAINDTAGHAAGDQALVHVAHQIQAALRNSDTVARLGGDEFVVVCEGVDSPDAAVVVADRVLAAVRVPFHIGSTVFALSASIGIGLSRPGSTADQLLHDADHAMYGAKRDGKARHRMSGVTDATELARSAQALRAMRIDTELRAALTRDELVLFGQPVYDVHTGLAVAVETLLRWQHPERGLLEPGEFLDVAEAGDLMAPIGRWALHESCRMGAVWRDLLGTAAPAVHVNVSGRQLEAGNLNAEVREALEQFQLSPSQLVLELTETHMPLIADSLRQDLMDLRTFGVRVAIDDLGTGYSSLTRITELPVDILKIDLRFVAGMTTDPTCAAVVHGILAIGSSLGLDVIAEGVETAAQARQLGEFGCTLDQGYLYSRPLAEPDLVEHLIRNRRSRPMPTRSDSGVDSASTSTAISAAQPAISPEARRSRSARHYIIDGPLTLRLETLLTLVSQSVGFPIARINIVDEDTQHTVSLVGAGDRAAIARAEAFCDTVVRTGLPVLVDDAATDPRFAGLRSVMNGEIGSYLGVPLIGRESMIIGAVCVIDPSSRTISPDQLERLADFGGVVEDQLDLIRRLKEQRLEGVVATEEIARAIRDGEIVPWYQPVVDLSTGVVAGFEALARWEHPVRGVDDPRRFIPVAEDSDLIIDLDLAVMRQALTDLKHWQTIRPGLRMSVNLSGRHFMDPNCATVLHQAAVDAGVDPSAIDLELTETSRIDLGSDTLSRVASQLRQLGFHLWLDDFGTGWSSLEYLLWLAFDGIKIDRAVTVTLGVPIGNALTSAVTGIANALGMKTTIEGIETPAHADLARTLGCDYGQGYIWAHPASAATIIHTLNQDEPAMTK